LPKHTITLFTMYATALPVLFIVLATDDRDHRFVPLEMTLLDTPRIESAGDLIRANPSVLDVVDVAFEGL
jgi:hypothetical protein